MRNQIDNDQEYYHPSHNYPIDYYKKFDAHELKLGLRITNDLATKLPNLEYLGCETSSFEWCPTKGRDTRGSEDPEMHYEHDWEGPRRDVRHDFANAVTSNRAQILYSLKRASLGFLSRMERTIDIRQSTPSPNLELLEVAFHPAHQDGSWYFNGPHGQGRTATGFQVTDAHYPPYEMTELDEYMDELYDEAPAGSDTLGNFQSRMTPDDGRLRPLLKGFAKATQMPALKEAVIWCPLRWDPDEEDGELEWINRLGPSNGDLAWCIRCTVPGRSMSPGPSRRLEWWTLLWRPDSELHHLFKQIRRA